MMYTREELLEQRERILKLSSMPWNKLKSYGENYQLDDEDYNIYRTIKSINWVLGEE